MRSALVLLYVLITTQLLVSQARIPVNFTETELLKSDIEPSLFNPFFPLPVLSNRGDIQKQPLRVIYRNWDEVAQVWQKSRQDLIAYNPNQEKIYTIAQNWNGTEWIDQYRANLVYSENHQVRLFQYEFWDGLNWHLYVRFTYDYDDYGNLIMFLVEDWVGDEWVNRYRKVVEHDYESYQTMITRQEWWQGAWYNHQQEIYLFNASYNCEQEIFKEWDGSEWALTRRNRFVFSSESLVEQKTHQKREGGEWKDVKVVSFAYNHAGNCTAETVAHVDPAATGQNVMWMFRYNAREYMTERSFHCVGENQWKPRSRDIYTYDAHERLSGIISQDHVGYYTNREYVEYIYEDALPLERSDISAHMSVFPNPVSATLHISYPGGMVGEGQISVYAPDGRKVFSKYSDNLTDVLLPVQFLTDGIYVVRTTSPSGSGVRIFLKE